MKLSAYLVGQMSADPRTFEWRQNVENYLGYKKCESIEIINPFGNKFAQNAMAASNGKEQEFTNQVITEKSTIIFPVIDRTFVMKSDIGICNLNHYTPERPIIGSFFELAWYFDNPEKTVIGIYDGDPADSYLCCHPFVWRTVHTWVKTEYEAVDVVLNICVRL